MANSSSYTREVSKKKDGSDSIRYKLDNKFVKGAEVPEVVKSALSNVENGVAVDEQGQLHKEQEDLAPAVDPATPDGDEPETPEEGVSTEEDETPEDPASNKPTAPEVDPSIDTSDDVDDESGVDVEEQARQDRAREAQSNDEAGMGFPRKKGFTVDVFDGKTPHTHVRNVSGIMVPLNKENYETRSDAEIVEKLKKLGKL